MFFDFEDSQSLNYSQDFCNKGTTTNLLIDDDDIFFE